MKTPERQRMQIKIAKIARRERLEAAGTCVDCGRWPKKNAHVLCALCLRDRRERQNLANARRAGR
jgi:hypothetical protein